MRKSLDSELFQYLGHPTRLKVVECLMEEEKNVGELQELVGEIKQGRLSDHLSLMRMCGHLYSRRIGRKVYYGIQNPRIKKIIQALLTEDSLKGKKSGGPVNEEAKIPG